MRLDDRQTPPVTDEAINEAKELIGIRLRRDGLNRQATMQNMGRWAKSIGDRNPMFLDAEHGRQSRYGCTIAPPLWMYSVDDTIVAPRMAGLHAIFAGANWRFNYPVRAGDRVASWARLLAVEARAGRFAGRTVRQTAEVHYIDQNDREVASVVSHVDRVSRSEACRRGLYAGVSKHRYTEEELLAIEDAYDSEVIRGNAVRYWEDVTPGEELSSVVRGPLTSEDIITFVAATHPVMTHQAALRFRQRHPYAHIYDLDTGRYDAWERSFLDPEVSRLFGYPLPHDLGYQRICWIGSLLTNWMGDDGQLRRLSVEVVRPNFHGDTTTCTGRVTASGKASGVVNVHVKCQNQRGEITARGEAEVELPIRQVWTDQASPRKG